MWPQQFGVYLCLSHFKLQFILDEIIHWIYDPSRINLRSLWSTYFGQLRSSSKRRPRSQDCPRLTGTSLCGENHLCCVIELFQSWNPKPTSFLSRCYVWEASVMNQSKHGIARLNGFWKNLPLPEKSDANISSSSYDMESHAKNAWKDIANWRTKQLNSYKVATLCIDDHQFKEEEIGICGELSKVCLAHRLFWNVFSWLVLVGPNLLWSVDKLARAVTKWTEARDKLLARLISYIHHTCEFRKHSTTIQIRIVSRFWFCGKPRRLKINIRWTLMHFRKSHVRANKLDVQETEISLTKLNRS